MTNAERIRAMTDEELCENVIMRIPFSCANCTKYSDLCGTGTKESYLHCRDAHLDWLKQEVEK